MKYLIPFLFLFAACAVVVHPTGGDKDETAPVALKCYPDSQATNFTDKEIRITFDEYFEIKDPNAILLKSSPTKRTQSFCGWKTIAYSIQRTPSRKHHLYIATL